MGFSEPRGNTYATRRREGRANVDTGFSEARDNTYETLRKRTKDNVASALHKARAGEVLDGEVLPPVRKAS